MSQGMILLSAGIALFVIAVISTITALVIGKKRKKKIDEYVREWY